uniref:TLC domain-containing protein n=4 Tax=Meloidogyne TaxID=189290 RepID=A0A6V7XEK5_MELEN|nr:unnamed protein product [Meloidogyne enterolobii]CAD2198650.1 unnamed protein product [Meloidogyne enterolobii]
MDLSKGYLWDKLWLPFLIALSSFFFFRLLQFIVRWYLFGKWTFRTFSYFKIRTFRRNRNKNMDSKSLQLVPPNKKWRISNEIVSLFHSVLSGLWALYILVNIEEYIHNEKSTLITVRTKSAEYLVLMSFGYLVHDFIDLVVNERSARIIELLFHHVVVLTGFTVTHITGQFLYIVVIGLLMEVNSIFLHTRSLMNLYRQKKNSTAFKIVAMLNISTFVLFRLAVSAALIGWLFYHYVSGLVQWYLQVINSLLVFSLTTTNCVLFYRVLAADGLLGANRARAADLKDKRHETGAQNADPVHGATTQQKDDKADETDPSSNDEDEEGTSDESDNKKFGGNNQPRPNYIEVPTHPTSSQEVFIVNVEN